MKADVVVLGLGGMGSAALYALARRGVDVIGLEQFNAAHSMGSSHGESRLIRKAYFEHPDYIPLLERAYTLWGELQSRTRDVVFNERTGLVMTGRPDSHTIRGTLQAARANVRRWTKGEVAARFPEMHVPADHDVLWDADGGILRVEACVRAFLQKAEDAGARVRLNERVLGYKFGGDGVEIETEGGAVRARHLLVTAGPWTGTLLADLGLPLQLKRKMQFWFRPRREGFGLGRFAPFIRDDGASFYYGFPDLGTGVKIAEHHGGQALTEPLPDPLILEGDLDAVGRLVRDAFPGLDPEPASHQVCMYTVTPDEDFIVDTVADRVTIACGFSGHGFKFAPIIGEALADLAVEGKTKHPIGFLRRSRFF